MVNRINLQQKFILVASMFLLNVSSAFAQTTAFTYQGKLAASGSPATGSYDFEFRLFDLQSGGGQQGATQTLTNITVSAGIFTVQLDFGVCPTCFNGAPRFLDINVRATGGGAFTQLSPRQPVTSNPYAIKSLNATSADGLSVTCLNCVTASQIASVNGSVVIGTIPVASVPAGSSSYIQNTASPQSSSNFNISGNGTAGGTLSGNTVNATTEVRLGGTRALSMNLANGNLFGGFTGNTLPTGTNNTFFGMTSGAPNSGNENSFFGWSAGNANTSGALNTFVGAQSGQLNTTSSENTFVGYAAGASNQTGCCNSFFGRSSGQANTIGLLNAFFGGQAGFSNNSGSNNTFVGQASGNSNIGGSNNTMVGSGANVMSPNLNFATAIGAGAIVNRDNTIILGRNGGQDDIVTYGHVFVFNELFANNLLSPSITTDSLSTSALNVNGTLSGTIVNATAQFNLGGNRILSNLGINNVFVGVGAGTANINGTQNAFFGSSAGTVNDAGSNSFFGYRAGFTNRFGSNNAFFGAIAGRNNFDSSFNSFFGSGAGNTNDSGNGNSFFGFEAGSGNVSGSENSAFGDNAGVGPNFGNNNSYFGSFSTSPGGINDATAIGARSFVSQSNSLVLGAIPGVNGAALSTFVGIGVSAPKSVLHLQTQDNDFAVTLTNNTNTVGRRSYRMAFDNDLFVFQRATDAGFFAENQVAIDQATGNLGIGTIDNLASNKLTVTGTIKFVLAAGGGSVQLCQNVLGQITFCSSSRRYKEDIHPFRSGFDVINRLRPVSFNWKQDGKPDVGLIAEEVAEVEPRLVTFNDKGEIEGVKYDRINVALINAVKQQQSQIEAQQKLLDQQRTVIKQTQGDLNKLQSEVKALKRMVNRSSRINKRRN